jgi:hypothetical protein
MRDDASLIDVLEFVVKIRIRIAVSNTADDELVQMTVRPAERGLKYAIEPGRAARF